MKQVKSYQTKDGRLFNDRIEAENHELMLNIRGFLHTTGRNGSLSSTDVASIIANNQDAVYTILGKYRKTMAGLKSATAK
jgi:dsDNA-binding SOS-regulon protein